MPQPRLPCVILAGGTATRMGGHDKALLLLQGRPLLQHVCNRIAPQCGAIALAAHRPADTYQAYGLPVLSDSLPGQLGPLAGILAGLDWCAAHGAHHMLSVAVDTPRFPDDLAERLSAAVAGNPLSIAIATAPDRFGTLRRHPTFGLWPVGLREDLRAALRSGLRKPGQWAARHPLKLVAFAEWDAFLNLNTPEDLARAEALPLA